MKRNIEKIKDGFFIGVGITLVSVLIFGLIIGINAFVQPTRGPSDNYVFDWSSPFALKINDTYFDVLNLLSRSSSISSTVNDTNVKTTEILGSLSSSSAEDKLLYSNKIPDESFSQAYSEVCIKNGGVLYDDHSSGGSTEGGNCLPGDIGFIVNKNLIKDDTGKILFTNFILAKKDCIKLGMRLPEPIEDELLWITSYSHPTLNNASYYNWEGNSLLANGSNIVAYRGNLYESSSLRDAYNTNEAVRCFK